ncbi:membrane protein insertion efficiency factor YidD [Rathayibacter soli]|uniref:membrane protein insertion efficiency factor YidD n=1 Tax=Rathayibacter soli TaxID=3144168 RepID=UPI0027E480AC|nr:membrane protein insertion efficiency factor YidD [Glaciibacter superstes]
MNRAVASVVLLPRNVVVLVLRAYRAVISPLYGDVCRYYPSCSAYALGAIQEHGVVIGVVLGVRRIIRCHPWASGGIDDVPLKKKRRYHTTQFGFVVANGQGKG